VAADWQPCEILAAMRNFWQHPSLLGYWLLGWMRKWATGFWAGCEKVTPVTKPPNLQ